MLRYLAAALAAACLLALAPAASADPWDDSVIYHVFVRSFRDSNGDRIGDLNGITASVPYLRRLGVNTVLLTPLVPAPVYHNYFASDFNGIEPAYGTRADFDRMVAALHRAGIKLILDVEFQYVTSQHPWWRAAVGSPASPAGDWILWRDRAHGDPADGPFGLRAIDHFGRVRVGVTTVALKAPVVRDWIDQYLRGWLDPRGDGSLAGGVDGFRLDHMMDDLDGRPDLTELFATLWQPAFARLRAVNPQVMLVGEQADWGDYGRDYLTRANVGAVFAFGLQKAIRTFSKPALVEALARTAEATPAEHHQVIFAENHDIDRIASAPGMTPVKLRTAAALVMLLKGTPSIYMGQELGMRGIQLPGYTTDEAQIPLREAFKWAATDAARGQATWYRRPGERYWDQRNARDHDHRSVAEQAHDPHSLLAHYRHLAALRHAWPALRDGTQTVIATDDDTLVIRRSNAQQTLDLVINLSARPVVYRGPGAAHRDLIAGGGARLAPWQAALFPVASDAR